MGLDTTLSRWLRTPDAPICEISLFVAEKRSRPYSAEEICALRKTMKSYCWQAYSRLFYKEGPFLLPSGAWPHPFHIKGLGFIGRSQRLAPRQRWRDPEGFTS
jgi:hypothetical protein